MARKSNSTDTTNGATSVVTSDKKAVKKNNIMDFNTNALNSLNLAGILPQQQNLSKNQTTVLLNAANPFLISNNRVALSYIYKNNGVIQAMIDQPVDDAFRKGLIIKTKDESFSDEDIAEIQFDLKVQSVTRTYSQGEKWARLFGGSGIIIDVAGQEPNQPLDISELKKGQQVAFYPADLWELNITSDGSLGERKPYFDFNGEPAPYIFYGKRIHKSRIIRLIGKEAPSQLRAILRGWGMSMVESMIDPLANFYELNNLTSNFIEQGKIDVFKILGLNDALSMEGGEEAILNKMAITNASKSINNGMAIDKEDDFQQKQISMSGVPELREQNRIELGASTRMPLTKTYGINSAAFNTGEDGMENYNGMVESTIRTPSEFKWIRILQIMFQVRFGRYPQDIDVSFYPLRTLTSKEEAELKNMEADRLIRYYDRGLIGREEVLRQTNAANLLPMLIDPNEPIGELPLPPPQKPVADLYGDDSRERNKLK